MQILLNDETRNIYDKYGVTGLKMFEEIKELNPTKKRKKKSAQIDSDEEVLLQNKNDALIKLQKTTLLMSVFYYFSQISFTFIMTLGLLDMSDYSQSSFIFGIARRSGDVRGAAYLGLAGKENWVYLYNVG